MSFKGIATFATFAGAAALCSVLAAAYPIAIWGVGYAVLERRKLARKQQPQMCPLLQHAQQVAATREREVR